MATRADYVPSEVETCYSVMIELMTLLGEFREHLVLIGGWVPYLLLGERGRDHVGSLDVDVALDFRHITDETYQTILTALQSRGYTQGSQPYIFHRRLGPEIVVEVDFLAAEYSGTMDSPLFAEAQSFFEEDCAYLGRLLWFDKNRLCRWSRKRQDINLTVRSLRIDILFPEVPPF